MDSIDITDSTFSLEMPDINNIIPTTNLDIIGGGIIKSENSMYIYIGIAILIGLLGIVAYKYFQNKKNKQSDIDCSGGFCNMNQNPNKIN